MSKPVTPKKKKAPKPRTYWAVEWRLQGAPRGNGYQLIHCQTKAEAEEVAEIENWQTAGVVSTARVVKVQVLP
jgi:hypothetical protein